MITSSPGSRIAVNVRYSASETPTVATFDRIVRAAGYRPDLDLTKRVGGADPADRGRELIEVLELAARFPARHGRTLRFPRFGHG